MSSPHAPAQMQVTAGTIVLGEDAEHTRAMVTLAFSRPAGPVMITPGVAVRIAKSILAAAWDADPELFPDGCHEPDCPATRWVHAARFGLLGKW